MPVLTRFALAAALACMLTACTAANPVMNCSLLSEVNREFAKQLRWREQADALRRVKPVPEAPLQAWQQALQPLEVVDCSVKEFTCTPATSVAQSILTMSYLRSGSATLRTVDLPLSWQQQTAGDWLITSPPPTIP